MAEVKVTIGCYSGESFHLKLRASLKWHNQWQIQVGRVAQVKGDLLSKIILAKKVSQPCGPNGFGLRM